MATEYKQTPEGIADTKKLVRDSVKRVEDNKKRDAGEYVLQEDDWYVVPGGSDEDRLIDDDDWQEVERW